MAIGDKPNQNLFGTDYNAEDEERKKAELAAQGAMMGSGETLYRGATGIQDIAGMQGVPQGGTLDPIQGARDLLIGRQFNRGEPVRISDMGSLIQEPGTSAFSMEAAGQGNPMMQPQNLESFAQPQVTFRDYDVPAPPPASALSVFTPGGEVKPNVDVNAITPSPEMTSTSAVNTALNQEVPVGSPKNNDPSFMSRLGSFLNPSGVMSGGAGLPPTFTPPSAGATQAQEGTDITPVTLESLGLESSGQRILKEGLAREGTAQAPSGASALGATQGVTPPVETPTVGAQEQVATLDPTSDEAILARRAQREAKFSSQGPMGQDATRAALGGMTLNEYLNAPAGTPGVSGLRTDPQGRIITPTPPLRVEPEVVQPPVDRDIIPAVAQPPVDALSSFEQDSLSRQQRIGGTGSFEGDSEAREARLRENERRPGETQTERDTRIAQSRTTGGQTQGMSFDDARRRAEGQLAERGVKNPSASQVNALARSIQAAEPERLAELETKRAKDAIALRDAEAKKDFKPQVVEIGDQKLIQLSPNYYQPVRPEPTAEEPFEPRVLEEGGFTYYEVAPNRFERQPSTKVGGAAGEVSSAIADAIAAGGEVATTPAPTADTPEVATGDEFTPQQELGIQKVMADNEITRGKAIEELRKAGKLK